MPETAFAALLLLSAAVYFSFLFAILFGLNILPRQQSVQQATDEFISIIVPCRNEAANLRKHYRSVSAQQYPADRYEIIYVDDHSSDKTAALLTEIADGSHCRFFQLVETSGKKAALEKGITEARGEIIITTDADCTYSPNWLTAIANAFTKSTGFISAPVCFEKLPSVFASLQSLEFSGLVLTGAGLIGLGRPVICNGANAAYRKSLFQKLGGFKDKKRLSSGDDELIMRKIKKDGAFTVQFLFDSNAIAMTAPQKSLRMFMQQRARWASKGTNYETPFTALILVPVFLFFIFLLAMPLATIFFGDGAVTALILLFLLKGLIEYIVLQKGREIIPTRINLLHFLLAELLHPPYIVFATVLGTFRGFTWKQRTLKK